MQLYGTIQTNVECAIIAARRCYGQRVYPETRLYWEEILALARSTTNAKNSAAAIVLARLADELEDAIGPRY